MRTLATIAAVALLAVGVSRTFVTDAPPSEDDWHTSELKSKAAADMAYAAMASEIVPVVPVPPAPQPDPDGDGIDFKLPMPIGTASELGAPKAKPPRAEPQEVSSELGLKIEPDPERLEGWAPPQPAAAETPATEPQPQSQSSCESGNCAPRGFRLFRRR